jgi:hypothetical protein
VWIFVVGMCVWASLLVATTAIGSPPIATLLPLLVIVATFEAVYALHVGVERIGRYLEVFYGDEWETTAMAFGRPRGAAAPDALFTPVFALALLFNLMPLLVAQPVVEEWIFIGGAHALFAVRLAFAKLTASKQRAIDRERFLSLKDEISHESTKTRNP